MYPRETVIIALSVERDLLRSSVNKKQRQEEKKSKQSIDTKI